MAVTLPSNPAPGSAHWIAERILLCQSPAAHDLASIEAYYGAITARLESRSGPYAIISDTRHVTTLPDARARRAHVDLSGEITKRYPGRCVHSVTISGSMAMRAMVTAVTWFFSDGKLPQDVAATVEEAVSIVEKTLARL